MGLVTSFLSLFVDISTNRLTRGRKDKILVDFSSLRHTHTPSSPRLESGWEGNGTERPPVPLLPLVTGRSFYRVLLTETLEGPQIWNRIGLTLT